MTRWQLLVDQRESCKLELVAALGESACQIVQLPLGDFVYSLNGESVFVIERKTHADWLQSIKDGRYHEQKNRLLQHHSTQQILYLLEGNSLPPSRKKKSTLLLGASASPLFSAILNTMFRDQLHVYQTYSACETVQFLLDLFGKFRKCHAPADLFGAKPSSDLCVVTSQAPTIRKKDQVQPKHIFAAQLCCLPGISDGIAMALVEQHFPSCVQFLKSLQLQKDPKQYLESLEIVIGNGGRKRKLGKVAHALVEFYLVEPTS